MKNTKFAYLLILSFFTIMISCSENELVNKPDEIEQFLKKVEYDKANSEHNPANNPQSAAPNKGGNYTCYTASMTYDYDCDYEAEATANVETTTWWCCWDEVVQMGIYAEQQGWCYYYGEGQCSTYSCSNDSDCSGGGEDEF